MLLSKHSNKIVWAAIIVFAVTNFLVGMSSDGDFITAVSPFLLIGAFIIVVGDHGIKRYGMEAFIMFFIISSVVSWSYESLSIVSGVPFGNYHYADLFTPKLGAVPIMIMPAYFAVGYIAWTIAHLLNGKLTKAMDKKSLFIIPLTASFLMVMWDLVMDPSRATIDKAWIWEDGGAYFGVPLTNYIGWFICVYTIFLIFAFYLRFTQKMNLQNDIEITKRAYWLQPVLLYGALLLEYVAMAIFKDNVLVQSLDSHGWWTGDIYKSTVVVGIMTMGFVVFLCVIKLFNSGKCSKK